MISRCRAFTLIEVMVALAIIAIALASLIKASGNHTHSASILKNKTLAHYVAMNEITRIRVESEWPDLGKKHKSSEMVGIEWYWTQQVSKVDEDLDQIRNIKITVYLDEDREQNIISAQGFISHPQAFRDITGSATSGQQAVSGGTP